MSEAGRDSGPLTQAGRTYVWGVVGAGALAIAQALTELSSVSAHPSWLILAVLALLGGCLTIRIPSLHATLSVADLFVVALMILFGPAPAIVTVAVDGFLASRRLRHRTGYRTLFNITEPVVSVWCAATVYGSLAGVSPLLGQDVPLVSIFVPLVALTTTYAGLNALLTAVAIKFETGLPVFKFLRQSCPHVVVTHFISLCLIMFIVPNAENIQNVGFLALVLIPALIALSYVLSKTYVARVEAAHALLEQ